MEKILNFIIVNPSYAIIIALVLIIAIREIGIKNIFGILGAIRGTTKQIPPVIKDNHLEVMQELHKQNQILFEQNKVFSTNHSMHEIPDIKKSVDRMELKLDRLFERMDEHGNRLTELETINRVEGKANKEKK